MSETNLSERIDTAKVDRELLNLAEVLNETFARLQAAFERQVRFTADASHELRTPLAIMRSQAELTLARSRTPEELREALKTCLSASSRMTELVEGLLTLARADAGKLELAYKPVDLRRLVHETIALLHPLAEKKRIRLEEKLAPAHVWGDASRLAQVITNLVSNAIHYNRAGGLVTVRLGVNGDWSELRVEDTGSGIPEADGPHIFERFYRVDKARSRASGGHGLGLAISKSIVEAQGGTISFESLWQEGTIFIVRLPENDQKDERDQNGVYVP